MGATIRALRGHAHISQIALGRRVTMHANYLGAIERGEIANPGLETVDRIASGLDVSIAVLAESYATAPSEAALRVDATGGRPQRLTAGYDAKALGDAIRIVRRRLDLTQTQLAEAIGIHRNQLGSIEVAERSSRGIATIARVAHGLTTQLGANEPPLLPLLAQVFNGEATLAEVRERFASKPSGSSVARTVPHVGADD
jgi:transcriptional regulator with XRE-family HTH domain